jgi:hypothetical protein
MPIHIVLTTPQEMFADAMTAAKEISERIMKLADLNATPLAPGETPDARRHQIAKFGKALAETFLSIHKLIEHTAEQVAKSNDVTAGPVKPDNPDAN